MHGDRTRRRVDRIFEDAGVERDLVVETQYAISHCNLVTLGVGCSIVNPATAIGFVSQGLVILPFRPRIAFEYLLYTPSFRALSQTALRFIEIMTEVRDELVAEIGRASWRERGCQSVSLTVVAGALKKNNTTIL